MCKPLSKMKTVKFILRGIFCLPIALIVLFVFFEIMGMVVNHIATAIQTNKLEDVVMNELSNAEILGVYSETGNTGAAGNHVDMLTIIVVQTDDDLASVERKLSDYYELDEWSFFMETMETVRRANEEYGSYQEIYDNLQLPEQLEHCYMIYMNCSAPFVDNIEGH